MAICDWCEQEMRRPTTVTCTANTTVDFPDGTTMPSVRYEDLDWPCHDCNIKPGGKHHPGCDMERCPRCRGQLISCGCLDTDEEE